MRSSSVLRTVNDSVVGDGVGLMELLQARRSFSLNSWMTLNIRPFRRPTCIVTVTSRPMTDGSNGRVRELRPLGRNESRMNRMNHEQSE
jgi:hypothetical protein